MVKTVRVEEDDRVVVDHPLYPRVQPTLFKGEYDAGAEPEKTWMGYSLREDGKVEITIGDWHRDWRRLVGVGWKLISFTLLGDGRVKIHILPGNGFMHSGSFILECTGLTGRIKDLDTFRKLALDTAKQLGWTQLHVADRRMLYTALGKGVSGFSEVDYNAFAETVQGKRYRVGEVDLVLEGHGVNDLVPEEEKFDLGFRLYPDGKVRIFGISRSRPLSSETFRGRAEQFEKALEDTATIHELTMGLGVEPQQVEWQENRQKAVIHVTLGMGGL